MSANVPRELMVLVERVVRPLPIPLDRQKRLRAEFLDHLQTIHAEELTRDADPIAALVRTQQRFGNPVELTAELRASIRWPEAGKYWFEWFCSQRLGESVVWYVTRLVSHAALAMTVMIGLLMADHHFFGTIPFTISQLMTALSAVAFITLWLGLFLLCGFYAGREWEQPRRRWARILPLSVALTTSWPLSLSIMMVIASGSWSEYNFPLVASIMGGVFSVVGGTFVGVLHCREMLYRAEWAQLDVA